MEKITKKPEMIKTRLFYASFFKIDRTLQSGMMYNLYKQLENKMHNTEMQKIRYNLQKQLENDLTKNIK